MREEWSYGKENYRKCSLEYEGNEKVFTTTILENEFEPNRDIDSIFYDHLANRQTKIVDLLFSGGADSVLVASSCLRNKIPVNIITMNIKISGITINHRDLYYSDKFCRENSIPQKIITFEVFDFFKSGEYLEYLAPYQITEPHVATHFWLIEKCQNFTVMCGDWPWVMCHLPEKMLSPIRLDYSNYDRFMQSKNIPGIGNMIGHSFESTCYFIAKHIEKFNDHFGNLGVSKLKQDMYNLDEIRLRSYGWEECPKDLFNIRNVKRNAMEKFGIYKNRIIWGEKIKQLLNTSKTTNDKFYGL